MCAQLTPTAIGRDDVPGNLYRTFVTALGVIEEGRLWREGPAWERSQEGLNSLPQPLKQEELLHRTEWSLRSQKGSTQILKLLRLKPAFKQKETKVQSSFQHRKGSGEHVFWEELVNMKPQSENFG